jgi:hypothetical protein
MSYSAASIHRVADKMCSRKPIYNLSDAYALGPVLRGVSPDVGRFRPDILLHVWMDIPPILGSGSAIVNVSEELGAKVSGIGSVEYIGDPTVNQDVSGVGAVRKH